MAILTGDLRLLASEVMADSPEGGGGLVESVIVDGQSNNIFGDIPHLARVYGHVGLRKIFAAVRTQTDEPFLGTHVILSKLPKDQKLGVNLFKTGDHFDTRPEAAARIENYRAQGAKYLGFLYGTQYQGSQTLTIFQSESAAVPTNGEVFLILKAANNTEQYVRVVAVTSVVQEFTDTQGVFKRRVVSVELANPLEYDFQGTEMSRYDGMTPASVLYRTTVANAAKYYSARPLKTSASLGDYSVMVDSVYSQVVPSSQSQTPLIDLTAAGNTTPMIPAAAGTTSITFDHTIGSAVNVYLGRPCYPSSLSIEYSGGVITDNAGQVIIGGVSVGTIDYTAGIISFGATAPNIGGTKTAHFMPAGVPLVVADTDSIPVTDTSRSFVYTLNINPPPQPGALIVSYMALGNWYELVDNAAGGLTGAAGTGAGTINYLTGSVAITLAALPDVGSEIMFAWGKKVDYTHRAGASLSGEITKQLAHTYIHPTSLTVTWNDGVDRTLTCSTAGVLSGHGSGQLVSATGLLKFTPATLPPKDTVFSIAYTHDDGAVDVSKITKTLTAFNMVGNNVELDLNDTNIVAGSLAVEWAVPWGSSVPDSVLAGDYANLPNPASGVSQQADRDNGSGGFVGGRSASINYSTGIVSFNWSVAIGLKFALFSAVKSLIGFSGGLGGSSGSPSATSIFRGYLGGNADLGNPTAFTVRYRLAGGATSSTVTETVTLSSSGVTIPNGGETLIAGSVTFDFAGKRYVDRLGQLYHSINPVNGAGTYSGTINYATGVCAITAWSVGDGNTGTVVSAISSPNYTPVDRVAFRTAQAPVKPASFSIRATQIDGGFITATSNDGGAISNSNLTGVIDNNTGIVKVDFGQWVTASGKEGEPWYNAEMVVAGQIFHPKPVFADSIIYNAVSFTFLPLSSDILGLNPVRLPIDGRIPVYHKGDVVVVLNDQTTIATYTSSSTTDLGRIRLAKVTVKDLGGNLLAANKWSVNLDTGIITWGDLSGVSQPLKIVDRIEDMAVLSDVQITGKLVLSVPVTHNYPADTTLVSNAVIMNDVFARASIPFDQQTWTNVWSDILIGNSTSAQYNANAHPIELTNLGTIEQKWALIFTNSTTFNLVGEHVGQIVTGASISVDLAPTNPATNDPYFTLRHAGFGSGWSAGNVLRFNTYQAAAPLWIIQSVAQGDATDTDYGFCIEWRGDVDAP